MRSAILKAKLSTLRRSFSQTSFSSKASFCALSPLPAGTSDRSACSWFCCCALPASGGVRASPTWSSRPMEPSQPAVVHCGVARNGAREKSAGDARTRRQGRQESARADML
eukprot:4968577-Pleurochrysis_carterae.AAC.2